MQVSDLTLAVLQSSYVSKALFAQSLCPCLFHWTARLSLFWCMPASLTESMLDDQGYPLRLSEVLAELPSCPAACRPQGLQGAEDDPSPATWATCATSTHCSQRLRTALLPPPSRPPGGARSCYALPSGPPASQSARRQCPPVLACTFGLQNLSLRRPVSPERWFPARLLSDRSGTEEVVALGQGVSSPDGGGVQVYGACGLRQGLC